MSEERYVEITEETLAAFELALKSKDYSGGTIEKYIRDLRRCGAWLEGKAANQENLVAFKAFLIEADLQPVTINAILSSVNTFCKLMNIPAKLSFLKIQKKLFRDESKDLSEKEYNKLIDAAEKYGKKRLKLIIETIGSTGIRVSELQYITVEAVAAGMAQISMKGKVRVILLSGDLCKALKKYAKKEKIRSGEIFVTKSGRSLSRKQIWAEMKALAKDAGVDAQKIFPHNLRHLFAKVFYRFNKNLVKLANLLGHSSIETTRIYLQTGVKDHRKDLEKMGRILLR